MSKDVAMPKQKEKLNHKVWNFSAEEKKRLVDYFSLLIEIDQKNRRKANENKTN